MENLRFFHIRLWKKLKNHLYIVILLRYNEQNTNNNVIAQSKSIKTNDIRRLYNRLIFAQNASNDNRCCKKAPRGSFFCFLIKVRLKGANHFFLAFHIRQRHQPFDPVADGVFGYVYT